MGFGEIGEVLIWRRIERVYIHGSMYAFSFLLPRAGNSQVMLPIGETVLIYIESFTNRKTTTTMTYSDDIISAE